MATPFCVLVLHPTTITNQTKHKKLFESVALRKATLSKSFLFERKAL
jgi:hypothetical protein